jgi:hypothetical protein
VKGECERRRKVEEKGLIRKVKSKEMRRRKEERRPCEKRIEGGKRE